MESMEPLIHAQLDQKQDIEENVETEMIEENDETEMTRKSMEYRSDLQGIRALAIVAVLLFHFYPQHFPNGYLGVDQFFVLSGFLMSMMLERGERLGFREIANFYYRRVRRILPLYLLVILLSLVASRFFLISYLQASNWESALYALTIISNIKAADSTREYTRMVSKATDLFTHTWSIALEMQFYFVFPVLFIIYKSIPKSMANRFLIIVVTISMLLHICLPDAVAFNMVHARLWQFILGVLVQQLGQTSADRDSTDKYFSINTHRIFIIMAVAANFFPFSLLPRLINRIACTFLTAGLIHFHPTDYSSILSSKCFTYVGKISYSLYLVHWPIYIITKWEFHEKSMGLHFGVVIAVVASVVLTETFEKAYLQANMKIIVYLLICLYATIAAFIVTERPKNNLSNDVQWINELSTPVCTVEKLKSPELCDIPINRMNLSIEEVIRINDLSSLYDIPLLSYTKCSYRHKTDPFGWCDLPPKNHTPAHKILVFGNSYASNQGRIVYETCAGSDVEVKIYSEMGCEVLMVTKFYACIGSRKRYQEAVLQYKPDVLFILTRHVDLMKLSSTSSSQTTDMLVDNAAAVLRDFSPLVTDRIFVLNAIPRQTKTFGADHNAALRAGKVLEQTSFINQTLNLARTRELVERAVALCANCTMIDYTNVFTVNGTFESFDERTHLAYTTINFHFTPYGLHRLRPLFKRICDGITYSKPISS